MNLQFRYLVFLLHIKNLISNSDKRFEISTSSFETIPAYRLIWRDFYCEM